MVANIRRLITIPILALLLTAPVGAQEEDPSPVADATVAVVAPTVDTLAIAPGDSVDHTFEINVTCPAQTLHSQDVTVTVNATLDDGESAGVTVAVDPTSIDFTFAPGDCLVESSSQNQTATLTVTVPDDAAGNVAITAGVEASGAGTSASDTITATTGIAGDVTVTVEDEAPTGSAGETYNVTITINNGANVDSTVSFEGGDDTDSQHLVVVPDAVTVPAGETGTTAFEITAPQGLSSQRTEDHSFTWTAESAVDKIEMSNGTGMFTLTARADPDAEDSPAPALLPLVLAGTACAALLRRRLDHS